MFVSGFSVKVGFYKTITSRNGIFVRECEQVNLMVGYRLLR